MKIKHLISLAIAAVASISTAATLSPIQLLNPAGSTAGQAIVSTGASTAPAWANVTASGLTPVAANTAIANTTGASAAPVAVALPSCSSAGNALLYTSGTGFGCGTGFGLTANPLSQFAATTSAQLAGNISDETGSGSAVFGTSPTLTTPTINGAALSGTLSGTPTFSGAVAFTSTITPSQTAGIVGTTTNNNANTGSIGEYLEASPASVGLSTNTFTNIASISLTAGDWDVTGVIYFLTSAGDTMNSWWSAINTTSATLPAIPLYSISGATVGPSSAATLIAPVRRISIAATTTVYLIGRGDHTGGTLTAQGIIRARRVR